MSRLFCTINLVICLILISTLFSSIISCSSVKEKISIINSKLASSPDNIIRINSIEFENLTTGPRNFILIVLMNAISPQYPCAKCESAIHDLKTIMEKWKNEKLKTKYASTQFYSAMINFFDNGKEAFEKTGVREPPYILLYTTVHAAPLRLQDTQMKNIVALLEKAGIEIPFEKSINWTSIIVFLLLATAFMTLLKLFLNSIQNLLSKKQIWMGLSLLFLIFMISGHMWNSIRGASYIGGDGKRIQIIMPQFQSQFAIETQIVSILYSLSAVFLICLICYVPKIEDASTQKYFGFICLLVFLFCVSAEVFMFRFKGVGYPFSVFF